MTTQEIAWYLGWHIVEHGGPGSGNWGHASVKGRRGGSAPKSGMGAAMSLSTGFDATARQQFAKTGEVTAELVRGAMTRQFREYVMEHKALADVAKKKYKAYEDYRDENISPLFKKRNNTPYKTEEWYAISQEIESHQGKSSELYNEWKVSKKELRARTQQLRADAVEMLAVPKSQQATVSLDFGKLRKGKEEAQAGVDIFNKLVGTGTVDGLSVPVKRTKASRAFYSSDGSIGLSTKSSRTTMIHELGHWLEDHDPQVVKKAFAFLARRTQGEKEKSLKSLTGASYKSYETAKPDQFIHPYMGKKYKDGTEILSMGLEMMYHDPVKLARSDPDYFDFIFNTVRGK